MTGGVIVVGSGGHAKVCVELLQAMGERVDYCVGLVDSAASCVGVPVLKGDEHLTALRAQGYRRAFIAIGSNYDRERAAANVAQWGFELVNAVSPNALVSPTVRVGVGVAIMAGVVINAETEIADLAIINTGATVDHDCRIGKAAHVAPQCSLAGNVVVGARTTLGIGSVVIPGVAIGDDVVIGAGGVVVTDVESRATAVGVPVRVIRNTADRLESN